MAALGFCCGMWVFSSCGEQGLLSNCGARASHCGGFSCGATQALGTQAPVAVAQGLISCGSQALERADFSSYSTWAQWLQLKASRAMVQ